ncbi:hypothetical protein N6H07_23435, partial [Enterobacter cloacae]|uniref:hypothetical protein n=1 Tax=Enterobacter cloacae TaxID=550 RepID=UPI0021C000AA
VEIYPGGFADFASSHAPQPECPNRAAKKPPADAAKKQKQHEARERERQASRDRDKRVRRVKELEELIAAGEKQLGEMRARLREDPGGDWE